MYWSGEKVIFFFFNFDIFYCNVSKTSILLAWWKHKCIQLWNLAANFCWSFIYSLKAPILSANRILEEKVNSVLICQDLTVWVSHKMKFALGWKSQYFSFFPFRIGKKSSLLSVCVLTHKLILTVTTWCNNCVCHKKGDSGNEADCLTVKIFSFTIPFHDHFECHFIKYLLKSMCVH